MKFLKQIENLRAYARELGSAAAFTLAFRRLRPASLLRLRIKTLPHLFICRPTVEDIGVVRSVIGHRESFIELANPKIIIDAGGHIGTSAAVFANAYPAATVLCIEPDTANFALLVKNTKPYQNVRLIKGALWSKHECVHIRNPNAPSFAFQIDSGTMNGKPTVDGMTLADLLDECGTSRCDLLKIDIEGSEFELMRDTPAAVWKCISVVVIELHERFRPGVFALTELTFPVEHWDWSQQGEYVVLRQK